MHLTRPLAALVVALGLLADSGLAASAGDGSLARVRKAGKLVAACDLTYPPMAFEDGAGKPDGYSVDVAREVGRRIGAPVEYSVVAWDGILVGLQSKRYDAIICTMNITKERQRAANFVEFAELAQVFVTRRGTVVRAPADLKGKAVAVQADTTSQHFVEEQQKNGIAVGALKGFKLATDAFAALRAGLADVIVVDEPVGRFYAKQDPKTFVVTGEAMAPEPVGIALNKKDVELHDAIAAAIADMKKDGTFARLGDKWFGGQLGKW
jgi:ABC-type amino acid transport substrate-binding protein